MKKNLKDQDRSRTLQLRKETLQNLTGGTTLGTQPITDQVAPGTTDWTCTDYPTGWC